MHESKKQKNKKKNINLLSHMKTKNKKEGERVKEYLPNFEE